MKTCSHTIAALKAIAGQQPIDNAPQVVRMQRIARGALTKAREEGPNADLLALVRELKSALADGVGGQRCVCHDGIHGDRCWPCRARAAIKKANAVLPKEKAP